MAVLFWADSTKLSRRLLIAAVPLTRVGHSRVTSKAVLKQLEIAAVPYPHQFAEFNLGTGQEAFIKILSMRRR
jgi:hypothetical protein